MSDWVRALAGFAALLSAACGGGGGAADAGACDVEALFANRCSGDVCHSGSSPAADLDLVSPGFHEHIVGARGNQCTGTVANPADPESSLLYVKVAGQPACGSRMPLVGDDLTEHEVSCVRDWISGLLPPNPDPPDAGTQPDAGPGPDADTSCTPDDTEPCYTGPPGTEDTGICVSGSRTCQQDGTWGACQGEQGPLGENCTTTSVDENCDGLMPPCTELWSLGFGTAESQSMRSVAVDATGNIFVAGDFEGTVNFGGGPLTAQGTKADIVVAKYDRYGNHLWSKRFGDTSNQFASQIAVDPAGNIIVMGRAFGTITFGGPVHDGAGTDDIFVAKLDTDGDYLWSRIFGGVDPDRAERLAIDADGDVLISGTFTGSVDFGAGSFTSAGLRDAFVLKLQGTTGAHVFSHAIGSTGDDYGWGIDADADGNVFIAGRFQGTITIAGGGSLTSAGGNDIYLAKLTEFGVHVWSSRYGSTGDDAPFDLAVHRASGDLVTTGYISETVDFGGGGLVSAGSRDIFVARMDNDGGHGWSARYGDATDQFESDYDTNTWSAVALDAAGNVHLAGPLFGSASFGGGPTLTSAGKTDAYLVELTPTGGFVFGNRYGRAGTEIALDVAVASDGYAVIVGRTFGTAIDFGASGSITTHGSADMFIARFMP